MLNQVTAG